LRWAAVGINLKMENFNKIKSEIINSILIKIYRTEKPINEFWFDGLGNLSSYKYVMELNNRKKYEFHYDYLCDWNESEKIIELETEFKNYFKNKRIENIIVENETNGIYFRMENNMVLYHNNDFGSELGFESYTELFNEKGQLI
jgi:hypothetical protein